MFPGAQSRAGLASCCWLSLPAVTTTLDGTLRAIVAADRLDLSETVEGRDFLHRRLLVFYGYFGSIAGLGTIVTLLRPMPQALDPELLRVARTTQTVHAIVLCSVFTALWFLGRNGTIARTLDVLATLATATTAAVALSVMPQFVSVDVAVVAFFVLFFVVRAALVPGKPWVSTVIAGVSAIPFGYGLAVLYRNAGTDLVPDPQAATFSAFRVLAGGVAGVYLVSRTIYGLRSAVAKAVQLGQYVIHEKIGEGGMGSVYRASHAMLKRPTAIKVIPPDRAGETATARFEREVMATSRLTHPNSVAIYDYGRTRGGVFYYAMELLDGEDLERLVEREGAQPMARARHILRQLSAALAEAHDAGLVHRDIKPSNVMLCTRGGVRDFVKVFDFGLVKDIGAPASVQITSEQTITGTPLYMAPESMLAPEQVGPPADIYGVGCVAYFLLTGRTPFLGNSVVEVCAHHVHSAPEPPSKHAPVVTTELDAIVLRCLEKRPEARPSARELEAAFGT
jgi:serine/threonine-protein kinase